MKCNPTLLGAERVRGIVNDDLGYADVPIPDEAFGHDLKWADASRCSAGSGGRPTERGVGFGLKLSNTLEVENWRPVFDRRPDDVPVGPAAPRRHGEPRGQRSSEEFGGELPALVRRRRRRLQRGRPARRAACGRSPSARTS